MENKDINEANEEKMIHMFKELIDMKDAVLGVTLKLFEYKGENLELLKKWYEIDAGHELRIPYDSVDLRNRAIKYLKSKGMKVNEDKLNLSDFEINRSPISSADILQSSPKRK